MQTRRLERRQVQEVVRGTCRLGHRQLDRESVDHVHHIGGLDRHARQIGVADVPLVDDLLAFHQVVTDIH